MNYAARFRFVLAAMLVLFLLTACTGGILTLSAQDATGGVGAGLSEVQ